MRIYLVRHATATEHFSAKVRTDAERPLVEEGRAEAQEMAKMLKRIGVRPDLFLTSPLVRARQTAEIFAEVFGRKLDVHLTEALAPGGRTADLFRDLNEHKGAAEVFCFGHMPDIANLAASLLLAGEEFDMPFKKAAVCCIEVYSLPPVSAGTLKWMVTPKIAACCH